MLTDLAPVCHAQVMPTIVRDMEDRIEIAIHNRMHYRKFFFGTMWLFFHFAILLNLNGTFEKYGVKDSVTKFIGLSNSDKEGMGDFPSGWYEWFDGVANELWTDPFCGNGICEVCTCEPALDQLLSSEKPCSPQEDVLPYTPSSLRLTYDIHAGTVRVPSLRDARMRSRLRQGDGHRSFGGDAVGRLLQGA